MLHPVLRIGRDCKRFCIRVHAQRLAADRRDTIDGAIEGGDDTDPRSFRAGHQVGIGNVCRSTVAGNHMVTGNDGTAKATATLTVTAGSAADQLAFGKQPTRTKVSTAISPAVTVRILDQYGNLVDDGEYAIEPGPGLRGRRVCAILCSAIRPRTEERIRHHRLIVSLVAWISARGMGVNFKRCARRRGCRSGGQCQRPLDGRPEGD
jgi:hypothetical protein